MKISKTDIGFLLKNILIWTLLNFSFNLLGLWISKLIYAAGFNAIESFTNEFVKPILIQSTVFAICFFVGLYNPSKQKNNYLHFHLVSVCGFSSDFLPEPEIKSYNTF